MGKNMQDSDNGSDNGRDKFKHSDLNKESSAINNNNYNNSKSDDSIDEMTPPFICMKRN